MRINAPKPADVAEHAGATRSGSARRTVGETEFVDNRSESLRHRDLRDMAESSPRTTQLRAIQTTMNERARGTAPRHDEAPPTIAATGLPDGLKAGIESLSGMSMDHVKVHYGSSKPAQLDAHAYAQGGEIHVAPGQEQQLPHEAWHVVQQAQGRVKPTASAAPVNDDPALEAEADVMGARAAQRTPRPNEGSATSGASGARTATSHASGPAVAQLRRIKIGKGHLANLQNANRDKGFAAAIAPFVQVHGEKRVHYLASQLFSAEGEDFESLDQFLIELDYDLATKSIDKEPLTLQEQYMTEYGWKRAEKAARPAPSKAGALKLKLYRTMSVADWKRLDSGDFSVLAGGHIGDFKQALKYFLGSSPDAKVMVEFTLKAGSEAVLFSNRLAFPKAAERTSKLKVMAKAIGGAHGVFPQCNTAEGTSDENVGVKSESEGEAGFSIGIGGGSTPETFMALVESAALKPVGDRMSAEPSSSGSSSAARVEADARLLLNVNNCLINAIALGALGREATLVELTAIRGAMNNYGEMLLASPAVVGLIRQTLNIQVPITVHYGGNIPDEDFAGVGHGITIYHVNGNHFTHELDD